MEVFSQLSFSALRYSSSPQADIKAASTHGHSNVKNLYLRPMGNWKDISLAQMDVKAFFWCQSAYVDSVYNYECLWCLLMAVCKNFLILDVYSLEMLSYKHLLLRLAKSPPLSVRNKHSGGSGCCSQYHSIRLHTTPWGSVSLHVPMYLFFLHSFTTPKSGQAPVIGGGTYFEVIITQWDICTI